MMDTKTLNSSQFTPILHSPAPITLHRLNASFPMLKTFSASQNQLKSTLLRQPDFKPRVITAPPQPESISSTPVDPNTILDVLRLFDGLKLVVTPDIYASLVAECTRNRDAVQASELYAHMKANYRMVKYLKGSSGLLLFNRILMMFVMCSRLDFAHQTFDEMPHRNSVSLAVLVAGFVDRESFEEALGLFVNMYECCIYQGSYKALQVVVACVLKACVCVKNVNLGKMVHGWLIKIGYGRELFVGTALVEFYGKCRCLSEANRVFFHQVEMDSTRDTILWTCAIVNNCRQGNVGEVIRIVLKMGLAGVLMNEYTVSSVLKACGRVTDGSFGRQVHGNSIKLGLDTHIFVMCGLVDMYGRCGLLTDARKVFDMIDHDKRSSACWNAMVTGFIEHGMWIEALKMLYQMKAAGLQPKQSIVDEVKMACGSAKPGVILLRDSIEHIV